MITDMNARVAMAQKLSIPQLQQAIKNGTIPAYVGVPLLQDKMRQQQQMQMAAAQQQQGMAAERPPIAEEIMEQAGAMGGVDQLPSNLPIQNEEDDENYAGGGIIAFNGDNTSEVRDPDRRSPTDRGLDELIARINRYTTRNAPATPEPAADNKTVDPETSSDREAIKNQLSQAWAASQDIGSLGVRGLGTAADYFNRGLRAIGIPESVAPRVPGEYTFNRSNQGLTPYTDKLRAANANEDIDSSMAFNLNRPAAPETTLDTGMFSGVDLTGPDVMPPKTSSSVSGASSPAQRGAPPLGAPSSATSTVPASLDAAERQAANGSSQASAALNMVDKYVAMIEKSGEDVGRQKKEALYMALIQGGLGMMGGTSPNAFANISAGLLPATQAYQQAIAGIRKDDRQRLEKLMAAGISKEKLILEAEKLGIERTKALAMANYYNARAGAAGAGAGVDAKNNAAYNVATTGYNKIVTDVDKQISKLMEDPIYKYTGKNPELLNSKKTINDRINALERRKENAYTQYRGFVTDKLRIDVPDYSDTSGGGGGKYEAGKKYKDAQGNVATYKGKDASGKDIWE